MPGDEDAPPSTPPPPIAEAATGVLAVVGRFADGPTDVAVPVADLAAAERDFGPLQGGAASALTGFFANGGQRAYAVRVASPSTAPDAQALLGEPAAGTGFHALAAAGDADLVCLPDAAELPAQAASELYGAVAAACAAEHRFLLVDLPHEVDGGPGGGEHLDVDAVRGWAASLHHGRDSAALYVPRAVVTDPHAAVAPSVVPTSGHVAGVIARTDRERGVWKAPAGTAADLRGIVGLEHTVDVRDQESLTLAGVNPLRHVPDVGDVLWGARTLAGADATGPVPDAEWRYLPVRRMASFLERSLLTAASWTVLEPNDAPLWTTIVTRAEGFLDRLWRRGAFAGATPREAFVVRCGPGSTMTEADVASGVAIVVVGFAASRPAEFVLLRLRFPTRSAPAASPPPPAPAAPRSPPQRWEARTHRGERVLVVGAPGAIRARTARAVAADLGAQVVRIDLRSLTSRYIGETEKNLGRRLDAAEAAGATLLFDEADALFGRRTAVSDAGDRYANQVVSYLRVRLASYTGAVVLAAAGTAPPRGAAVAVDRVVRAPRFTRRRPPRADDGPVSR